MVSNTSAWRQLEPALHNRKDTVEKSQRNTTAWRQLEPYDRQFLFCVFVCLSGVKIAISLECETSGDKMVLKTTAWRQEQLVGDDRGGGGGSV